MQDEEQLAVIKKYLGEAEKNILDGSFLQKIGDIALEYGCDQGTNDIISRFKRLREDVSKVFKEYPNLRDNYKNYLLTQFPVPLLNQLIFQFLKYSRVEYKQRLKESFENQVKELEVYLTSVNSFVLLHQDVGWLVKNLVIIGANGSGKTSIAREMKQYMGEFGVFISAQKVLFIDKLGDIPNQETAQAELSSSFARSGVVNKGQIDHQLLYKEINATLKNLIADELATSIIYKQQVIEALNQGSQINKPSETNLDRVVAIWNGIIKHRKLSLEGVNLKVSPDWQGNGNYDINKLSDGEKTALFHISQVIQAPENGFIIVDEPEMYLHKTILSELWDVLEKEREDCIFIYLTHDLDFAVTRVNAIKSWLKKKVDSQNWEIEKIPETDEIPEALMLELAGSRKPILFCESKKGSKYDEAIYSALFSEFVVKPVEGCRKVRDYTKAFNELKHLGTPLAYGLVDADYHDQATLESWEQINIYSLGVAEIENLFLTEEFLQKFGEKIFIDKNKVMPAIAKIKQGVADEFEKQKDLQASRYVTAKIDFYFKDSHVHKGNNLSALENNFENFVNQVNIKKWYIDRLSLIETFANVEHYTDILCLYNNKGLPGKIVGKYFDKSKYLEDAIAFLNLYPKSHEALLTYFPQKLIDVGRKVS